MKKSITQILMVKKSTEVMNLISQIPTTKNKKPSSDPYNDLS
jgi:hypothetical protein